MTGTVLVIVKLTMTSTLLLVMDLTMRSTLFLIIPFRPLCDASRLAQQP